MNDKSSGVPDAGTSEEPALTRRNTATVGGEQDLGADGGAAPTYGPAGNTTDAEEEGADGQGI
ncbi:MAG: hypothetical protein M3169_18635 [Candidatus Eremiobacteraeota bacterium]|nr:hypothetical protein [Candidatus Eremiobacteraeota bacterium]